MKKSSQTQKKPIPKYGIGNDFNNAISSIYDLNSQLSSLEKSSNDLNIKNKNSIQNISNKQNYPIKQIKQNQLKQPNKQIQHNKQIQQENKLNSQQVKPNQEGRAQINKQNQKIINNGFLLF